MKRSISSLVDQLLEKDTTYVSVMNFKFLNLCIKAEECSLIPIKVNIEGSEKNLENVASVAKKDDYSFYIVPNYDVMSSTQESAKAGSSC